MAGADGTRKLWPRWLARLVWSVALIASATANGTPAPWPRATNQTLHVPQQVPISGYALIDAFPEIRFDSPVALAAAPGETNRLFVVERTGRIFAITNLATPTKTLFLDLSSRISADDTESGLLGLAFHPNFQLNRRLFVFWTGPASTMGSSNRFHDIVARFEVRADDADQADPTTEAILLAQFDDNTQHNGGDLKFGPDGYLYIALGERHGRDQSWPDQTPIDRDLLGAILRIDVDERPENLAPNSHPASIGNYRIPADNPFIGATTHHGLAVNPSAIRTELYATGLRNPWRIAFDLASSNLWVADVGENQYEEVNLILPGRDYGWPYQEGDVLRGFSPPPVFTPEPPVHAYAHGWAQNNGDCIIGGMVYQGSRLPLAGGNFVFGDFRSGHLWALQSHDSTSRVERLTGTTIGLSTLGPDPRDGEILAAHLFDGTILKLVYQTAPSPADPRQSLAETGVFADLVTLQPNPGVVPFEINAPFWSDHAIKRRWFALNNPDSTIGFQLNAAWQFPTGTVWIKHFDMELTNGVAASVRRLETRLLVQAADGYYGLTYRWDESQTNAWLVTGDGEDEHLIIRAPDGSIAREQDWRYPSRAECMNCHTKWGGRALGFNTAQLNRDVAYDGGMTTNQIGALAAAGYVSALPPALDRLPALAPPQDPKAPIEFRVRSYLQANCSACHVPGGPGFAGWNARIAVPLPEAHIVGSGGIVQPNDVPGSIIAQRLMGYPRLMPPIGTGVQNTNAQNLIAQWIAHLPAAPWTYGPVGAPVHHGGALASNEVFFVGGAGQGWAGASDDFEFLHRPAAEPATDWLVRLSAEDAPDNHAMSGLMIRWGTEPNAPFALVGIQKDGTAGFVRRTGTNTSSQATWGDGTWSLPRWLRLTRTGDTIAAAHSDDRTNWVSLGLQSFPPHTTGTTPSVGLAAHSASPTAFNQSVFDQLGWISLSLTSSLSTTVQQPINAPLVATVAAQNRVVDRVEFFDGTNRLAELRSPPFQWTVTNVWSGSHAFTAQVIDDQGIRFVSPPFNLQVLARNTQVQISGIDTVYRGQWPGVFGDDGFLIARYATNLAADTTVSFPGVDYVTWSGNTRDPRALQKTNSTLGIAAAWRSTTPISIELSLRHGAARRVSLYFLDWNNNNRRVQRVEFLDPEGAVLSSQVISNFSGGVYLSAEVRGAATIRIHPVAGADAVLSGLFFDALQSVPPEIEMVHPRPGELIQLPAHGVLEARLAPSTNIQFIELHLDGRKVGRLEQPPYEIAVGPWTEGTHAAFARVTDTDLDTWDSPTITFTALLPTTRATFLFEDVTTRGDWIGIHGQEGFLLPPIANRWPEGFAHQLLQGEWFPDIGDSPDYLEHPSGEGRVDPLLYAYEPVEWKLSLPDGKPRRVSLYFRDTAIYPEVVRVLDAANRHLLDQRWVTNGLGGRYLAWNVQGNFILQISNPAPGQVQTRVNGLFLDPISGSVPEVTLLEPAIPTTNSTPARILLAATAQTPYGVRRIEFHSTESYLDEVTSPPFEYVWDYPAAGDYQVFARAVSLEGAVADSAPVHVRIEFNTQASARFRTNDTTTGGNWINKYGHEGYWIPSSLTFLQLPAWISLSLTQSWNDYGFQPLPSALATPDANQRIVSFWNGESWRFQARCPDGRPHRLTLYNFAPGWTNAVDVHVRATDTGIELDRRRIDHQNWGTYLGWEIQGDVTFEFSAVDGTRAFVNGLFFDPVADPYGDWQRRHFRGSQLLDPLQSGFEADPDGDHYVNWSEFLLGRNPATPVDPPPLWVAPGTNGLQLHLRLAAATDPATIEIEVSGDLQLWQPVGYPFRLIQSSESAGATERIYLLPAANDLVRFFRLRLPPTP